MKFGALQSVIGEQLPEVFAAAANLGFDGVQLDWNDPAYAREGGPLGSERRSDVRAAASEAGVQICSVAAHFHKRGGLADGMASTGSPSARGKRRPARRSTCSGLL